MGTKKKTSNGSKNGAGVPVQQNLNLLQKKNSPSRSKSSGASDALLQAAEMDRLVGLVDGRELLRVLTDVRNGNFKVRMPIDEIGLSGKICDTLNEIISINEKMMNEFTRAGNTI